MNNNRRLKMIRQHVTGPLSALLVACALPAWVAHACDNHGPGFGFYPMGSHMESAASLSNQLAEGMALTAEPRFNVTAGQMSEVPFTVIVPESFQQANVIWQADDVITIKGDNNVAIDSGSEQQLVLNITPSKPGTYVLRGKLNATLAGEPAAKSAFILIKVSGPASQVVATTN
ncbi:hypothetical protein K0504_17830 [Neiella marina]|uniref:Uncharacterized protein n=1 Tax=Neiella holothuriorum TaxID=2870530 RepID=A0ABS7EL03_9GAMM|nr:hypothetical protein [Neiella holothuriorum]MBW8192899.1 hypothetical protein [Neiella holothuriorum]